MNKAAIEREARKVQFEVWSRRKFLWPAGNPPIVAMFEPRIVAPILELEYELREQIGADGPQRPGFEAAGLLDRRRRIVVISSRFGYPTQRFTAAHEIGHYVLHPWIGDQTVHRDRAVDGAGSVGRAPIEQEADYFAACLLVPLKLLEEQFFARFSSRKPLPLTETVAFHLGERDIGRLFAAPTNSLTFARLVARAESFDTKRFQSLADHFGVSVGALAIRLREAGLIVD